MKLMSEFFISFREYKYIYIYYLFLFFICASWTETNMVAPSIVLRTIVTGLVFLPLFKYVWLLPTILVLFVGLRFNSIAPYGYIPQTWSFYLLISIVLCLFNIKVLGEKNRYLIGCAIYVFLVDLFNLVFFSEFFLLIIFVLLLNKIEMDDKAINLFLFSFVFLSIILSIYYFLFADKFEISYDITDLSRSTWVDPNYFGILLGCGVIISLAFLMKVVTYKSVNRIYFFIFLLCFILSMAVIILQASRGAISSIFSSFFIMFAFSKRIDLKHKILFLFFVVLFVFVMYHMGYLDLLFLRIESDSSGSGRIDIWNEKLSNALDNNFFLIGGGYQNAVEVLPKCDPHNDYLALFLDYGVCGVLFYIIFLVKMVRTKNILLCSFAVYCFFASLTISPVTNPTGWCSIPFFMALIYKLKQ